MFINRSSYSGRKYRKLNQVPHHKKLCGSLIRLIIGATHRHKHMTKKIKDKYKNVSAYSFTTYNNELVVSFDGFEDQKDIIEFADFVFTRIKMRYWHSENVPTFH
ncbi:hypothetical protein N9A07_00595 [Candidatus Pelagibacter ubique]|nr:hypothetical protein [Candidatus Pelagibacter ubique]